jgi:hypothetical protein
MKLLNSVAALVGIPAVATVAAAGTGRADRFRRAAAFHFMSVDAIRVEVRGCINRPKSPSSTHHSISSSFHRHLGARSLSWSVTS